MFNNEQQASFTSSYAVECIAMVERYFVTLDCENRMNNESDPALIKKTFLIEMPPRTRRNATLEIYFLPLPRGYKQNAEEEDRITLKYFVQRL